MWPRADRPFLNAPKLFLFVQLTPSEDIGCGNRDKSQSSPLISQSAPQCYFRRLTAILNLRPGIACCPAGEAVKDFTELQEKTHLPSLALTQRVELTGFAPQKKCNVPNVKGGRLCKAESGSSRSSLGWDGWVGRGSRRRRGSCSESENT